MSFPVIENIVTCTQLMGVKFPVRTGPAWEALSLWQEVCTPMWNLNRLDEDDDTNVYENTSYKLVTLSSSFIKRLFFVSKL